MTKYRVSITAIESGKIVNTKLQKKKADDEDEWEDVWEIEDEVELRIEDGINGHVIISKPE